MLVATKPKRRNRLALPRSKPSTQASTSGRLSQRSSGDESVTVTTVASSRSFPGSIAQSSQTQHPGEQLCSSSGHPGGACSASEGFDPSSGDAVIGVAPALCKTSYETITESQTTYNLDKKSKRTQGVQDPPVTRSINSCTAANSGKDANGKAERRSTPVPFQTVQHNAQPVVVTNTASESIGQQKAQNGLTIGRPTGDGIRVRSKNSSNDSTRVDQDNKPSADVQRRRRESQPDAADVCPRRKSGEKTRRLGPSGSGSERSFSATFLPKPETTRNHLTPLPAAKNSSYCRSKVEANTNSSCAVSTEGVEKLGEESIGWCKVSTLANYDTAPTPAAATVGTEKAASTSEGDSNPTIIHSTGRDGKTGGNEVGGGSGQRCPVCGAAVWGLTVRARQVHINSCLDGNSSSLARAEGSVGEATVRSKGDADDAAAGGGGERPGASSGRTSVSLLSTGLAKEPKTEFQADIQMAKALSKSLLGVPAQRGGGEEAGDDVEGEPQDKEELARDPEAFRAREKKLLARLKDLDQRMERLQKDREIALKRLSAHRALGARVCADASARARGDEGEEHGVALKTAAEVVDVLFTDGGHVSPMAGGTRRGEKRKAVSAGRSFDQETRLDVDVVSSPKAEGISVGGECAGEPRLLRRRSSGGGDGHGRRLSSLGGNTLWSIAQNADELSQSRFVTGVFADVRAGAEKARTRGLREGSSALGSRTATVTASAYGDPSLYNRRTSGAGPRDTGDPGSAIADTEVQGASVSVGGREANSGFGAEGGERRCGNDDRVAERDSTFSSGTETAADEAILLLTQTLSGQSAISPRPQIEDSGAGADVCAAERAAFEDVERIAAQHIARAPVAAVSRFFPDWEENVRFVFQQGAPELRDALESISAALAKEEETEVSRAAAGTAIHGEGVGRLGVDGDEVSSMAWRERTGKVEALLFFEGIILEALELKSPDDALVASTTSVSGGRDLPDEGVSSARSCREGVREAVDPAGELCDEGVPGGVCEGVEDHSGRDDDSNSGILCRPSDAAADFARNGGNAMKDGGAGENWRSRGLVEGRAHSPNTSKGTATDDDEKSVASTVFLGGDSPSSSRDAIVTLDLTTPGKSEREAREAVSAALKSATVTADVPTISSPSIEPTDGDCEKGGGMECGVADPGKDEEESITGFDLLWDDPLGVPSPCDELHALPLTTRPSPQTTPTKHQQMIAPTAPDDSDSREEEPRSFDLTGALPMVSSRSIPAVGHYGHRDSPPSIRLESPERVDARPTTTVLEDSERSALLGGGGDERGAEEEEEAEVMPPFDRMTQQELTGMMSVYGLKKKSRRDMVERLNQIWKALHPTATDKTPAGVREDGRVSPTPVVASSRGRSRGLARAVSAKAVASGRPPLARPRAALDNVDENDPRRDEVLPPCSASRDRTLTKARAAEGKNKEALGEQIRAVVTGNAQLHEDILLLRTLELTATQVLLKEAGVKCSKRDLASYLDDKGITFVDRGAGARAPKRSKKKSCLTGREEGSNTAISQRDG